MSAEPIQPWPPNAELLGDATSRVVHCEHCGAEWLVPRYYVASNTSQNHEVRFQCGRCGKAVKA